VEYILHEVNQPLIVKLIYKRFGHVGCSIFYRLIEHLGSARYHYIIINSQDDLDLLLLELGIEEQFFMEIMRFLVKRKYLDEELFKKGVIFSDEFVRSVNPVYTHRGYPPWTSTDVKNYLSFNREKEAKREIDEDNIVYNRELSEIGVTEDEMQISESEIPPPEAEIPHKNNPIKNKSSDFCPKDLIQDIAYIRNKSRITGISTDLIKSILIDFIEDARPGQYTNFNNFNFDFDQVLKNIKSNMKVVNETKLKRVDEQPQKPQLKIPQHNESHLDEICLAVLEDTEWVYNNRLNVIVKQYGYSYNLNKEQHSNLLKLFANRHYGQFANVEEFKKQFIQWSKDLSL
jgi:hypothetical protein